MKEVPVEGTLPGCGGKGCVNQYFYHDGRVFVRYVEVEPVFWTFVDRFLKQLGTGGVDESRLKPSFHQHFFCVQCKCFIDVDGFLRESPDSSMTSL